MKRTTWTTLGLIVFLAIPVTLLAQGPGVPETETTADIPEARGPFAGTEPLNGGGTLYLTSVDSGTTVFAKYDPATDSWTQLDNYSTTCLMAVSAAGELFAHNHDTGDIDIYDPGTDTWSYYMDGPPVASPDKCNLEVTNDGEFFLTIGYSTDLYYTSGGSWNLFTLPFNANIMGDYDPTTNQYVIGQYGTVYAHLIDVDTFAITSFTLGPGSNGEWGRFNSILSNRYYYCAGEDPIRSYDLSDPDLPAYDHGAYPGFYVSSAVDRASNLIYTASLNGTQLWAFDAGTDILTPLTGNSYSLWHSGLAFVPEAGPEVTMHVGGIEGYFSVDFMGRPVLRMFVLVEDETYAHLGLVQVDAQIWVPDAGPMARSRYTRASGWARFHWGSVASGTWTICVDDLTLDGYVYNPDDNVVTCQDWYY